MQARKGGENQMNCAEPDTTGQGQNSYLTGPPQSATQIVPNIIVVGTRLETAVTDQSGANAPTV